MNNPAGIVHVGGNLYVTDRSNHRIVSFVAATGEYRGWIGRVGSAPTGGTGCSTLTNGNGYVVTTAGWCKGGSAQAAAQGDRGGGFNFWDRPGITSDGTYLYIANAFNYRIDKYTLGGVYQGSVSVATDVYNNTWTTDGSKLNQWATSGTRPLVKGLYADATNVYAVTRAEFYTNATQVLKFSSQTGNYIGWKGAIVPGASPNNGEAGCAGATLVTPGWCQGGGPNWGMTLGGFDTANLLGGDANFVYVTDEVNHRVTRLTK